MCIRDSNKRALIQYLCDVNKMNPQLKLIKDECIIMKRLTWKSSVTFLSCHHRRITFKFSLTTWTLLFYWCSSLGFTACCTSFHEKYDGKVIDINAMVSKLGNKSFDLLAVHALSGCDTMSYPFGKWQISALNLLLKLHINLQAVSYTHLTLPTIYSV